MELWIGAINLGCLYAVMTMGVFITFRVNDFTDITVDGSFTAGASLTAVLIVAGVNPYLALIAAFFIGMAAGIATGIIHTRYAINGLLAGILVMTGLYSINLFIMGKSNISLLNQPTVFSVVHHFNPGINPEIWMAIMLSVAMLGFFLICSLFFATDLGIAMRVTGHNPVMAAANGINVARLTTLGIGFANGLVGVSGGLIAQYEGFADIGMGIGTVLIGLAAVIIGEALLPGRSLYIKVLSVIAGSVIFRMMIAFALFAGMNPLGLKLLTAVFVLAVLIISRKVADTPHKAREVAEKMARFIRRPKVIGGIVAVTVIALFVVWGLKKKEASLFVGKHHDRGAQSLDEKASPTIPNEAEDKTRISRSPEFASIPTAVQEGQSTPNAKKANGIVDSAVTTPAPAVSIRVALFQFDDSAIMDGTKKGFMDELHKSGAFLRYGLTVDLKHAQNELSIAQSIVDEIVADRYDFMVTLSSAALQVAAQGNKTIPHVFGVVTDPYRAGVAKSPTDHLPHITGIATTQPVESAIKLMREIFPSAKSIGYVWNPAEACSQSCSVLARKAAKQYGFELIEGTVTGTSEVVESTRMVISRGIDLFLTSGDRTAINAMPAIAGLLSAKKIPYITNNPTDVDNGVFMGVGADYYEVGEETAKMLERLLAGEKPADIPIKAFVPERIHINQALADAYGIKIPAHVLARSAYIKKQ